MRARAYTFQFLKVPAMEDGMLTEASFSEINRCERGFMSQRHITFQTNPYGEFQA